MENIERNLITIHTHPSSYSPSIEDLNSNYENEYTIGIVCCHDGRVYIYKSETYIVPDYYKKVVEKYIKRGYNELEAQEKALKRIQEQFPIMITEVKP